MKNLGFSSLIFFISKACILIAPIFAAAVLSKENYGLIEWALSFAMIFSSVFSFGSGNTIAFENLKKEGRKLVHLGQKYSMIICFIFFSTTLVVAESMPYAGLILGISSIFVIQYALSARLKSDGKGAFAGLVDSSFYILLLILTLIISVTENENILSGYAFSIVGLLLLSVVFLRTDFNKGLSTQDLKLYFVRGAKIILATNASLIFFNLPRIFLGNESLSLVAEFSLYFRWASIAIIIYRFFSLVYFRDLYTMSIKKFDRSISFISVGVLLFGFIILFSIQYINSLQMNISGIPLNNTSIQFMLISIICLWCISGSLEGLIYREKKPLKHLYAIIFGSFFFVTTFIIAQNLQVSLVYVAVLSWLLGFIATVFFQLTLLKKEKNIGNNLKFINLFFWSIFLINFIVLSL